MMDVETNKCEDKMAFDEKKQAEDAARVAAYQHGADLKVYLCSKCKLWHMASNYGVE